MDSKSALPIREVSVRTGVNSVTLRAWERRYGLIKPTRTAKGHRLYSQKDLQTINSILVWLDKGVSIGKVKPLLKKPMPIGSGSLWERLNTDLLELSVSMNFNKLESTLKKLSREYPSDLFIAKLIKPWLNNLLRLERADQPIIQHFSQQLLRQLLLQWMTIKSPVKCAVISCGEVNALELLLLRYELQDMDIQSFDLGALQPMQLKLASDRLQVKAILVSLGAGLNARWFEQHASIWPEQTYFTGEIGTIYQQSGFLTQPFVHPVKTLNQHETFTALAKK